MQKPSGGFTILELIIIIGILGVLFFVVLINTRNDTAPSGNAQRKADVNALLTAIGKYRAAHGKLPDGITDTAKKITSTQGENTVNLCSALVPEFMTTVPLDPTAGSASPEKSKCTDKNARYNTGYTVQLILNGGVNVAAPGAQGGEVIFASD